MSISAVLGTLLTAPLDLVAFQSSFLTWLEGVHEALEYSEATLRKSYYLLLRPQNYGSSA
jgi:hypothetical protein